MRVESDASFNEKIKDKHKIPMLAADTRGILPVFQTNDRLQMLKISSAINTPKNFPGKVWVQCNVLIPIITTTESSGEL